ncbi:hypothetical protein LH410_22315 [Yersinia intermedia]|nr:hypothetical protein [Yersinia intermedia]MCB5300583.1 hypothetical protein [Yersinia intermedia]
MDFPQAILLFLLIENRGEGIVSVFSIAAQVSDILLLFIGIANGDSAIGYCRMGICGDWLTESGITDAEQLEVTAAPGVLRLQRWEGGGFGA